MRTFQLKMKIFIHEIIFQSLYAVKSSALKKSELKNYWDVNNTNFSVDLLRRLVKDFRLAINNSSHSDSEFYFIYYKSSSKLRGPGINSHLSNECCSTLFHYIIDGRSPFFYKIAIDNAITISDK